MWPPACRKSPGIQVSVPCPCPSHLSPQCQAHRRSACSLRLPLTLQLSQPQGQTLRPSLLPFSPRCTLASLSPRDSSSEVFPGLPSQSHGHPCWPRTASHDTQTSYLMQAPEWCLWAGSLSPLPLVPREQPQPFPVHPHEGAAATPHCMLSQLHFPGIPGSLQLTHPNPLSLQPDPRLNPGSS